MMIGNLDAFLYIHECLLQVCIYVYLCIFFICILCGIHIFIYMYIIMFVHM
jgi:hypothetical protein